MDKIRKLIRGLIIESQNDRFEKRISANLPVPQDIWDLKSIFERNGKQLYVVGGAVRDFLGQKPIKDYDLATDAKPQEIVWFLPESYQIIEAGNIFPVIHLVTPKGGRYEIATFRADKGEDHRKPETEFATIEQDVERRDLTVNALFYDLSTKEIVDMVGGLDDLRNNRIRTVGDPTKRFQENQIRRLRAIRFAARMNGDLDDAIKLSLKSDSSLSEEAPEAILSEFIKGVAQAKSVVYYMEMVFEYGLDKWIFRDLKADEDYIIEEKNVSILFASIIRGENRDDLANYIKTRLKYPSEFAKKVHFFIALQNLSLNNVLSLYDFKEKKVDVSSEEIKRAMRFMNYDRKMVDAFLRFTPIAKAADVMAQGFSKQEIGREMKRINVEHFLSLIK